MYTLYIKDIFFIYTRNGGIYIYVGDGTQRIMLGAHGCSNILGPFCQMAFFDSNALTNMGSRQVKISSSPTLAATTTGDAETSEVATTPATNVDDRLVSLASCDDKGSGELNSTLPQEASTDENNSGRHVSDGGGNDPSSLAGVRSRKVHGAVPHDLGRFHHSIVTNNTVIYTPCSCVRNVIHFFSRLSIGSTLV